MGIAAIVQNYELMFNMLNIGIATYSGRRLRFVHHYE